MFKSAEEKIIDQWTAIQKNFSDSIKNIFPISGRKRVLEVGNITYDESKADVSDIKSQQLAKDQEKTWGIPVFAEFILKDKETGEIVNKSKQKIAVMPKQTQRDTYILSGGEYNSAYQWRLKSGIYSKITEAGELETEISTAGKDALFIKESRLKIPFDRESKSLKVRYGTNQIPLYSFLKALDYTDEDMKKSWGEDIYNANKKKNWEADITKMYNKKWKTRGLKPAGEDFESLKTALKDALNKAKVFPDTTKITLGKSYTNLTPQAIMDASLHIISVAKGEKKPDDVYSLYFKHLLGLDDFISEKFGASKTALAIKSKIRNQLDRKDKISSIITTDIFNKPLGQVFYGNALSQRPDQTNPLDILSSKSMTTIMGPGGISSEHALRNPMKTIHQSQLGFIDPLHTPEGESTGITNNLPIGVKKVGREAKALVYDIEEKKFTYKNPAEVHGNWTVSPDQIKWTKGHPSPISKTVRALNPLTHEFDDIEMHKAKYILPSPRNLFDEATNSIPFLQNNQGNRTMTGSRQPTQGVSLKYREPPLVQVKSNTKDSFEKVYGSIFSHISPVNGKIVDIVKDDLGHTNEIHVDDGSKIHKIQTYNNFQLNDKKSFLHAEPIVKIGDKVEKGQTIADSNSTKNGVLSVGTNLHTAYMNLHGLCYEDSVAISESAAKKLTSEHLHRPGLELGKGDIVSLNKYLSYMSTTGKKLKKEKLASMDENGVVKVGSIVKPGDLLIAAVGKNELTGDLAKLTSRLKGAIVPFRDKSLTWDSDHEGKVVRVVKRPGDKGYTVHIRTEEPMKIGDKLCFDAETEILTKDGWKFIENIKLEDYIHTLNPKTKLTEFFKPIGIYSYSEGGDMYRAKSEDIDIFVTVDHNMYIKFDDKEDFEIISAKEIINKKVNFLTGESELKIINSKYEERIIKNYSSPVYCLTVPNHIIYMKRGGKCVWISQCGRAGDKNIVGAIIPDHQMPRTGGPDGKPLDMITSYSGVVSRINIGQLMELAASKIAQKKGEPYVVQNFQPGVDYAERLRKELKEHNLSDTDKIYDPVSKTYLENEVMTGNKYIMKLKHQVEKKESVRGMDQALARKYSINEDPSRGGGVGAQAISQLDLYALLAHGARANLKEMSSYKAERQHHSETMADTDFWNRVMLGLPLQPPKPTFAYRKFEAMLTGMGINLKKEGHDTILTPLTDKGVLHLSAGEIDEAKSLRGKDDTEIDGGIFDPKKTGGLKGQKWSSIKLAEPFPNPLFVGTEKLPGPAVVLSGMKFKEFNEVIRAHKNINVDGKDLTGGKAIEAILKNIDVKKELKKTVDELKDLRGSNLDKANKKAKFLQALSKLNMKADEAYIVNHIPMIPPIFRPITIMPDNTLASADINDLYLKLIQDNNALKDKEVLTYNPDLHKKLQESVYDKIKAVVGIGSVPTYDGNRRLKGLAQTIAGDSPKTGFFQNKIMKRRQELSMRSTITPAPDLQMDQVGMPRDAAMELYKPFVIRELVRAGKDLLEATKEVKESSPIAWKALDQAVKERPVLLKRDPVLHKYNIQAFFPILKEGQSIGLHPLSCAGLNADYDGNCFIGSTKVLVNFNVNSCYKDSNDIKDHIERLFNMKFKGSSKVVLQDKTGALIDMSIEEIPIIKDSKFLDKNGASVYKIPEGVSVWSYDHSINKPIMAPITHLTIEGNCKTAIIKTRRFEVTASTNESLCVYDHDTEEVRDISPENAIGKLSPVMASIPQLGDKGTFELGWLIGAFVSDGSLSGKSLVYTKVSQEHRDRFYTALQSLQEELVNRATYEELHGIENDIQGLSIKEHYSNVSQSTINFLKDFYIESNEIVRSALKKKLPDSFTDLAEEALVGLLTGLFDGDGSISLSTAKEKPQVIANFSTSSPHLVKDVEKLCRLLNIRNSVTELHPKEGRLQKHINYVISFSIVDLKKYARRLSVISKTYKVVLNYLQNQKLKDDLDIVPVPSRIMNLICSKMGPLGDSSIQRSLATSKSARKKGYYVTRTIAKDILEVLKEKDIDIKLWEKLVYAENVHWDVITSVEEGNIETVYDLVVPSTKIFAVNGGLIVWDTTAIYLPLTEEARREAIEKMLPSKNLFSTTNYGIMHAPDQEAVVGMHLASQWGKKVNKVFNSVQDVLKDKSLHRTDVVKLKSGKETTAGRAFMASLLPISFSAAERDKLLHDPEFTFKKGTIHEFLEKAAKTDPKGQGTLVDGWRNYGNEVSFKNGFSFNLSDLKPLKEKRDSILKPYHEEADKVKKSALTQDEKDKKIVDLYSKATLELDKELGKDYEANGNNIKKVVDIKARGSQAQFRQTVIAPMLLVDTNNRVIPTPVTKSYAEGLSLDQYWTALHGARMGVLSRAQGTSQPGAMAKEIVNLNISTSIASPDCGTKKGAVIPVIDSRGREEIDITDRFLVNDINHDGLHIKSGTLITPEHFAKIKNSGLKEVEVRSPLKCQDAVGICQKCMGNGPDGHLHEIGTNVGIIASHAISEPAIQLAMDAFHCLHKDTLVFVRQEGGIFTMSMESIFSSVDSPIETLNNEEIKRVDNMEIHNGFGEWTKVTHVRRHKPDDTMVMVSSGGLMTICQNNHPIATFPNMIKCNQCNYHRLKKDKKRYVCPKCNKVQVKGVSIGEIQYKSPSELEIKRSYLYKDISPILDVKEEQLNFDPYLIGIYLAEGCVIFEKGIPRRISIGQNDGPIKDRIIESLSKLNKKFIVNKRNIVMNNSILAKIFHDLFGRYAANKALPFNFLSYNNHWLAEFLCGLIDGDGTKNTTTNGPDQIVIDTTSFELCQQIVFIAAKLNIVSSSYLSTNRALTRNQGFRISLRITKEIKELLNKSIKISSIQKCSPAQDVIFSEYKLISNIKPVFFNYNDFVYDCTTKSGTLIASGLLQHNTGGAATSRGVTEATGLKRAQQLLNIPKNLPNSATLAKSGGIISSIEKDNSTNGHTVFIKSDTNTHSHYIPPERKILVNVGEQVHKGDSLSSGSINPHQLLQLKNMDAVRDYLTDGLSSIYKSVGGTRRRNIELVVKNLTNLTEVVDSGHSDYLTGDVVPLNKVQAFNSSLKSGEKIIHKPILKGIKEAALLKDEDYLNRMNFQRIQATLVEGVGKGWKTTTKNTMSPIAPWSSSTIDIQKEKNNPHY